MAAFEYRYRVNGMQKVSAQIAGEVCEELRNSEKGLTPATLLDASRAEDAPLHNEFQWDDTIAAEQWRTKQARDIILNIRTVLVRESGENIIERAFVNIERGTTRYIPIREAMENDGMRDVLLAQARGDIQKFKEKYGRLEELSDVFHAMDAFVSK